MEIFTPLPGATVPLDAAILFSSAVGAIEARLTDFRGQAVPAEVEGLGYALNVGCGRFGFIRPRVPFEPDTEYALRLSSWPADAFTLTSKVAFRTAPDGASNPPPEVDVSFLWRSTEVISAGGCEPPAPHDPVDVTVSTVTPQRLFVTVVLEHACGDGYRVWGLDSEPQSERTVTLPIESHEADRCVRVEVYDAFAREVWRGTECAPPVDDGGSTDDDGGTRRAGGCWDNMDFSLFTFDDGEDAGLDASMRVDSGSAGLDAGDAGTTLEATDGCGCSVPGARHAGSGPWPGVLLLPWLFRRRRRVAASRA